jgi:phosphate transport system protein
MGKPSSTRRRATHLQNGSRLRSTANARAARRPLEQTLREIEDVTLGELERARGGLRIAVVAAIRDEDEVAAEVIRSVDAASQRYEGIHDQLFAMVARQAPVAGDLRLAIALLHVNDRIERISAQCMNIATLGRAMSAPELPSAEQVECLSAMADLTDEQLVTAARVFAERDVDGLARLRGHDLEINQHNRRCFELAVEFGRDENTREAVLFVAMMARAIERIGDNAVDVGRQMAFAVTGRIRV